MQRLNELLTYNPKNGEVRVRKSNKLLQADHDGLVYVFDSQSKPKSVKYKLDKLAFYFLTGSFPSESQKILHKNLDESDNRATNLAVVSRGVFNKINEAVKNLDYGIKLVNHPTDQLSYIVLWYESGVERSRVIQDVVIAKRMKTRLQLKFSKFLTKYCIFE